jgi:histidinol-phosphate aminotransferase
MIHNELMQPRIRPNVLAMSPYVPGKPIEDVKRELNLDRVIKLASNENPFGPSPRAVAATQEAATRMHMYPDGAARALREAVSKKFDVSYNQVWVGNGSDELIHLIGLLLLGEAGDEMMMCDPGFSRYDASAYLAPAKLVKVPTNQKFEHDLDAMADAVNSNTRLIYIANPNNPTGTIVSRANFERFLDRIPETVTVVLDEAYIEFAEGADTPNSLDYVKEGRNLIGLRTFSKAYGLAGIRVGYGWAPAAIIDAYERAREPFNVNLLAQAAGIAALDDEAHIQTTVANNTAGLRRLSELFRSVGAKPVDSYANFAYVDLGQPGDEFYNRLLHRGVIVRAGSHVGHPHCLRVSVGTPAEMDIFEAEFREVARELGLGNLAAA